MKASQLTGHRDRPCWHLHHFPFNLFWCQTRVSRSGSLTLSAILTFLASPFLISTSHVRDQRLNVLWQFTSVLPRRLYTGLYKTSTLTTYKEVLFISFLSRWQKHKGGDRPSVCYWQLWSPEGLFLTFITDCVVKHFNSNCFTNVW